MVVHAHRDVFGSQRNESWFDGDLQGDDRARSFRGHIDDGHMSKGAEVDHLGAVVRRQHWDGHEEIEDISSVGADRQNLSILRPLHVLCISFLAGELSVLTLEFLPVRHVHHAHTVVTAGGQLVQTLIEGDVHQKC
jgi:hypothetical protein